LILEVQLPARHHHGAPHLFGGHPCPRFDDIARSAGDIARSAGDIARSAVAVLSCHA
jgi:hypothetical protein